MHCCQREFLGQTIFKYFWFKIILYLSILLHQYINYFIQYIFPSLMQFFIHDLQNSPLRASNVISVVSHKWLIIVFGGNCEFLLNQIMFLPISTHKKHGLSQRLVIAQTSIFKIDFLSFLFNDAISITVTR
jgi:hypothetical protein